MFKNFGFMDQQEIQKIAVEALQRQEKQQSRQEEKIALIEEREATIDYGSAVFEEYTSDNWNDKVKKDRNIYNKFLSNIEEGEAVDKITLIIKDFLESAQSIYEHININPETYGFKGLMLDASEAELNLESQRIVDNFFNKHYFSLSNSERDKLYMEQSLSLAKEIVLNEEIEITEAMEHANKAIIVEKLLQEVNFPKPIYYRIQELMTSPLYGEIFEQEVLVDKWNKFKDKSNALSRVFAALI
jgi:hypothetical protein